MRTYRIQAAVAAALLTVLILPTFVQAQNPAGAQASRYGIAVVDVSYIFKKYERFTSSMEKVRGEVQAAEEQLKGERANLQALKEKRDSFKEGSPEYRSHDEELIQKNADLQVKAASLRKQFMDREAKIYWQTYLEVSDAVRYHAQRNNIGLVLRFNGETPDPNRREDVLKAINKPVVYQGSIDITPDILGQLNSRGGTGVSTAPSRGPVVPH